MTDRTKEPRSREDLMLTVLAWIAMAVAIVARVALLADKPFWRDEAWVAILVGDPMLAVRDSRAVPIGFLYLTKCFAALPGIPAEISYRLVPLLCGIAVLPLLAKLARTLGASRRTAVAAMWLAAGLQPLIYYSRELKPYDIDCLLAVVVPLAGVIGFGRPERGSEEFPVPDRSGAARLWFLVCLLVTPWVSFGGVFAVSALLGWGWIAWWRQGDRRLQRDWLLCSLVFTASFVAVYVFVLGSQSSDPFIRAYWRGFVEGDDRFSLARQVLFDYWQYVSISTSYFFQNAWPAFVALAAIGAWSWPRPQRGFLVFLYAVSALLCVVATVMDRYVIANGRHLLFAAPVLLLWSANGLQVIGARLGARGAVLALAAPVALTLWWSGQAIHQRVKPYHTNSINFFRYDVLHDVDAVIDKASRIIKGREPVLVSRRSAYAFQFYNRGRLRNATFCERHCNNFPNIAKHWLDELDGRGWVIVMEEDLKWMREFLEKRGLVHRESASARGSRLWAVEKDPDAVPRKHGAGRR